MLRNQSELRDPIGIKLRLIAEGHGLEREYRLARLVHRLDRFFEALRRGNCAEATLRTCNNLHAVGKKPSVNAGYIRLFLRSSRTYADLAILIRGARGANVDIITSSGDVDADLIAQRDVG